MCSFFQALIFVLIPACSWAQFAFDVDSAEAICIQYFNRPPQKRLERLDSIIRASGSVSAVSFAIDDIGSLTGERSSFENCYSFSGIMWTVTSFDEAKLSSAVKRCSKKIRKMEYDQNKIVVRAFDYSLDSTASDSLTTFVFNYVTWPVRNRIEYLVENSKTISVHWARIICADLNSITGCCCSPFTRKGNVEVIDDLKLQSTVLGWRGKLDLD